MKSSTRKTAMLVILILSLLATFACYQILQYGNHNLDPNNNWVSLKRIIGGMGLMGTMEFISQRQPLKNDRLNLAEWHGHNEVIWNHFEPWESIEFDAWLPAKTYLWVFFLAEDQTRFGFRFSRTDAFPSGFFKLDNHGRILERTQVQIHWRVDRNHLKMTRSNDTVEIWLNDGKIHQAKIDQKSSTLISFRSSLEGGTVDNVKIKTNSGSFAETFSPQFNFGNLALAFLICVLVLGILGLISFSVDRKQGLYILTVFELLLLFFLLGYDWIDRTIIIPKYSFANSVPFNRVRSEDALNFYEKSRQNFFNLFGIHRSGKRPFDGPPPKPITEFFGPIAWNGNYLPTFLYYSSDGTLDKLAKATDVQNFSARSSTKMAFMGTSQMWGAGSAFFDRAFASQIIKGLNQKAHRPIDGFNFSICGGTLSELTKAFRSFESLWKPDYLVINLSFNDATHPDQFRKDLEDFTQEIRKSGIKIVFVLEAHDVEVQTEGVDKNHAAMREIAQKENIPVFDLHGYMRTSEVYDTGLIWFDIVHFDQHGHDLAAQWMTKKLLEAYKF